MLVARARARAASRIAWLFPLALVAARFASQSFVGPSRLWQRGETREVSVGCAARKEYGIPAGKSLPAAALSKLYSTMSDEELKGICVDRKKVQFEYRMNKFRKLNPDPKIQSFAKKEYRIARSIQTMRQKEQAMRRATAFAEELEAIRAERGLGPEPKEKMDVEKRSIESCEDAYNYFSFYPTASNYGHHMCGDTISSKAIRKVEDEAFLEKMEQMKKERALKEEMRIQARDRVLAKEAALGS